MNPALLYRPRGRWPFWIAFVCAITIYLGALVLAKNKSESIKVENFSSAQEDVELVETEPELPSPEQSITPSLVEQIRPDQDSFQEGISRVRRSDRARSQRQRPLSEESSHRCVP